MSRFIPIYAQFKRGLNSIHLKITGHEIITPVLRKLIVCNRNQGNSYFLLFQ